MSDRAADTSYDSSDAALPGDANGPAQPARPRVDGFWEQAVLSERGLLVGAWALDPATGQGPAAFRIEWGRQVFQLPPNVVREDVARARQFEPATIGVLATLEVAFDPSEDLSETRMVAEWADGRETLVPPLRALQEQGLLRYLRFAPKDFYNLFQNPAFRCATPAMQAYGAACAMRMAGEDLNLWLAGAVVGIYRYIDQGVFPREQVERAIVRWKEIQPGQRVRATGIALRWATSMHLAAGYAHLEWGNVAAARDEFLAMNDYAARMTSWPQCLTNLGIGRCLAAILTIRLGERERALAMLEGAEDMFPAGVAPLKIWNFHMFEELRGALKVWQYNFVLKKYLEGEKLSHVLPPEFGFRLRDVSVVMAGLIARQRVPDWSYPGDIAA